MGRTAQPLMMTDEARQQLRTLTRRRNLPHQVMVRVKIALGAGEGRSNSAIARELHTTRDTVLLWRQRFATQSVEGLLHDLPRSGRPSTISAVEEAKLVEKTLSERPRAATHWSTRTLGKATGQSKSRIWRVWKKHDLKPHLIQSFKFSKDPRFEEKLRDVVGLYLNPPDKALVLAVDEKSQIQALERTQPILPLRKGLPKRMTHDYQRNGTTTLFAALDMLEGRVIGQCLPRHRHTEFIRFLNTINRQTKEVAEIHLIVDNYGTHKHDKVKVWLKRHRRFHIHFTPTSCSWLNAVEAWFSQLTTKRIRRESFRNVPQLIRTINDYITVHNEQPKPFVWTATAETILEKITYCRETYGAKH